jgi:hypothetical protein
VTRRLLLAILLISLLTAGCTGPKTQMPGQKTESPTVAGISTVPAVQVGKPHFVVGDEPFRFVGAYLPDGVYSSETLINTAKISGLSVLTLTLQWSQKLGGEPSLRKLDGFLDRASARGIYVIVSFVQGYGLSLDKTSPFYTPRGIEGLIHDQKLRAVYKDLLNRVVTRKNAINGRMYRDDPTIMAWDLITEPITPTCKVDLPNVTGEEFKSWLQEMTGYVRNLDPNHLVTMCLTGSINYIKDWPDLIMPELDFFFGDTNLYDMLFLKNQPMTEDYMDNCYDYPIYSLGKPVVPQLAFTSDKLDEKFAGNYELQGQIYGDALLKGFERGMAGATIFSWGTRNKCRDANRPFDYYLVYNAADEQIITPIVKVAVGLNTIDWPKPPLQFVRVTP